MEKATVMDLSKCGGICRGACKHYAVGVVCPPEATYEPRELKPLTLADIKEWMQITEGKGGIGRRDLMEWLITETERLTDSIDLAIDRLEEIDSRGGGPAWVKAKDILGGDLYLILHSLKRSKTESVSP